MTSTDDTLYPIKVLYEIAEALHSHEVVELERRIEKLEKTVQALRFPELEDME